MPNPPFQPLTLSVEERLRLAVKGVADWQAQAEKAWSERDEARQEAASLRQRLEDQDDKAKALLIEATWEQNNLRAHRNELLEKLSQAEAALADFEKWLIDTFRLKDTDEGSIAGIVLAELQRRRSPRAEETK